MFSSSAAFANAAWFAASLPAWQQFRRSASNVESTQRQILSSYLHDNAATEFGKQHRFADLNSWEAFAERVPAATYDDLLPWLDRVVAGEPNILTREPVILLEPSSGSTGPQKLLPYTRRLQGEFRKAIAVWITQTLLDNRSIFGGRGYWSLTPSIDVRPTVNSPIPVGFDEDSAYLGGISHYIIQRTLVARPELRSLRDIDDFWLATLVLLLRARDLRLISVWHPSYLLILLGHLRKHWDVLLSALDNGRTFGGGILDITADRRRAAELTAMNPDDATQIWPDLALISCWADAHSKTYVHEVQRELPHAIIQPKGLVATEAIASFPMSGQHPLAVCSHFFEFMQDDGEILPVWKIEAGREYSLLVTTGGGLYRYRLLDRVEVTGYLRELPCIHFLGKENNVSDHFGEKLSEPFVASVLKSACSALGLSPTFIMIALDDSSGAPGYRVYVQSDGPVPDRLANIVEDGLQENPHYELCVRLEQLRPARLQRVPGDAYEFYCQRLMQGGMRLGDIKPAPLSPLAGWSAWFAAA